MFTVTVIIFSHFILVNKDVSESNLSTRASLQVNLIQSPGANDSNEKSNSDNNNNISIKAVNDKNDINDSNANSDNNDNIRASFVPQRLVKLNYPEALV